MGEAAGPAIDEPVQDRAPDEDDRPRLVRFVLGDRELLVDVASVLEVLVAGPVTRLPGAAAAIAGVTSVRGRIVAVVDASEALGTSAPADRERFLVVATPGGPVALVVDRVDTVVAAALDPATQAPTDRRSDDRTSADPLVVATATIDGRTIPVVDPAAVIQAAIGAGVP
jgi:chemotaxis signal transduction protein